MKWRIMCEGEDHTLWCEENNIHPRDLEVKVDVVKDNYPCASVWTEIEEASMPIENW